MRLRTGKPFEFVRKVIRNAEHYLVFSNGLGSDGKPSLAMDSLKRLDGGDVTVPATAEWPGTRRGGRNPQMKTPN